MLLRFAAALAVLAPLLCGCGQDAAAASHGTNGRLTLTGSSTIAPLATEIARRFEELHTGARIDVQTGGSSKGIRDVQRGLANVGMASRALKGEEGDTVISYTIARDGVGLVVHGSNPVRSLTSQEVRSIYRGQVSNWKDVGGPDGEITVVTKASGRATLEVFLEHFSLREEEIEADVVIGDNQHGIKTVTGNPLAIGFVSIGAAEYEAERSSSLRLLEVDGVAATMTNVGSGAFPIGRPLNLVTMGPATGLARELIDYCRSTEVHDLIRSLYFVPVPTEE